MGAMSAGGTMSARSHPMELVSHAAPLAWHSWHTIGCVIISQPMPDYSPRPEHKFSFGLWTVSNRGRDPFGEAVRPPLSPVDAVAMLGDVGAWGVNLHDNDLVPIDATPPERDRIVARVPARLQAARHRRADGDGEPLLRSGLP